MFGLGFVVCSENMFNACIPISAIIARFSHFTNMLFVQQVITIRLVINSSNHGNYVISTINLFKYMVIKLKLY